MTFLLQIRRCLRGSAPKFQAKIDIESSFPGLSGAPLGGWIPACEVVSLAWIIT